MGFFGKNHMPVDGKTVLITGGSEGMGKSAACQLAAKGANIIIVSRNVERMQEAIKEISAAARDPAKQRFHYVSADVSQPSYASAVLDEAERWNGGAPPDIVWCVAGMSTPLLWVTDASAVAATRRNMDVNFYGSAEMAHAVLRRWHDPALPPPPSPSPSPEDARHLVFTSTVAAFYTVAGYGAYAPSKFALKGLADTLVQEMALYPRRVDVHVVYPGTIDSPGLVRESLTKPAITHILEKDDPVQSPDVVAARAIAGLESGHYAVTVAFLGSLMRWSVLGGQPRNNWLVDTLMACLCPIIWLFVYPDLNGKVKKFARQHGHPSNYKKEA